MKNKKKNGAEDERVKLKPVLGVDPGIYLTVLYSILVLAVVFFLVFFPGIRRHGTVLIIDSQPEGAAVLIDGIRVGSTPYRGFVSSGSRGLTVSKHFFESIEQDILVKGRAAGSLLFPRKRRLFFELPLEDPEGYARHSFKEFSSWAMTGESTFRYPVPLVLSDTAADFVGSGTGDSRFLAMLIEESVKNVTSRWLLSDLIEGAALVSGDSLVLTAKGWASFVQKIIHVNKNYSILPIVRTYFDEELEVLGKKDEITSLTDMIREESVSFPESTPSKQPISIGSVFNFFPVPGGSLKSGGINRSISSFYMMETEVTRDQFMLFLRENPQWQRENREELLSGNVVTSDYLADFSEWRNQPDVPAAFVSRYAAEAFCSWIQRKYREELSGFTVRLPDEWEWEYAALLNGPAALPEESAPSPVTEYSSGTLSLGGMSRGVWEWCGNWYFSNPALRDQEKIMFNGVTASVRGGSWVSTGKVEPTSRGSQPPFWCTPFLGFRPVLILEGG